MKAKSYFRGTSTLRQIQSAEYKKLSRVCAVPKHLISGGEDGRRQRVLRRFDSMIETDKELALLRRYYDEYYVRKWSFQKLTAW